MSFYLVHKGIFMENDFIFCPEATCMVSKSYRLTPPHVPSSLSWG